MRTIPVCALLYAYPPTKRSGGSGRLRQQSQRSTRRGFVGDLSQESCVGNSSVRVATDLNESSIVRRMCQ
jgi:hypothetical protein